MLSVLLALHLLTAPPPISDADALCPPLVQQAQPQDCLPLGPGHYAAQVAEARAPDVLTPLSTAPLPRYDPVVDFTYARVTTPDAPVFATPADAAQGVVKETLGNGFIYVSVGEAVSVGDQWLYPIRRGGYIRAGDISAVKPTTFQGLGFDENPARPFGWIVANKVQPSRLPGASPDPNHALLYRRAVVQLYATHRVGAWDWYLIGPNQWVEQRTLAKVDLNPPPEGVSGKWIQVNLYEQTMAAYEDNRLVYATLVSSGLDKWATEPGLFHIWARLKADRMSGAYEPDRSDYYYLEAVPWVMYFDGSKALHGEYWHDRLGFKRSHGCVNLAPLDARWLFEWSEQGTPVWVYDPSAGVQVDSVAEGP
jgi:hypothetical protein